MWTIETKTAPQNEVAPASKTTTNFFAHWDDPDNSICISQT